MTDRARESAARIGNTLSPCRPRRQRQSMGAERTGGRPAGARADSLLHAHGNLPPSACGSRATRAPSIDSNYTGRCGRWRPPGAERTIAESQEPGKDFAAGEGRRRHERLPLRSIPRIVYADELLIKSHARTPWVEPGWVDERLSANGARCAQGSSDGSAIGGCPAQRRPGADVGRKRLWSAVRFLPRHTRSRRGGVRSRGRARRAVPAPSLPSPLPRHLAGEPHALRGRRSALR